MFLTGHQIVLFIQKRFSGLLFSTLCEECRYLFGLDIEIDENNVEKNMTHKKSKYRHFSRIAKYFLIPKEVSALDSV